MELIYRVKRANFSAAPLATFSELQPKGNVIQLADSLCSLNLLETTQLVNLLQVRHKDLHAASYNSFLF